MSKCYALSGLRAAYAVTSNANYLRKFIPPWAVSLPAQIAAIESLNHPEYFKEQYEKIHKNRELFSKQLSNLGFRVYPGVANYILTELPEEYPKNSSSFVSKPCLFNQIKILERIETFFLTTITKGSLLVMDIEDATVVLTSFSL